MSLYIPNVQDYVYQDTEYGICITDMGSVAGKLDNTSLNSGYLLPTSIEGHLFHDIYWNLYDKDTKTMINLQPDQLYYLSFDVGQLYLPEGKSIASGVYASDTQNFTVKLKNSGGGETEEDGYQNLKNFSVKVNEKNDTVHCELLFKPNGNYNYLVFSLTRALLINGGDIGLEWPNEGALGRRMTIHNVILKQVNNLIPSPIPSLGQFILKAPAGMFFSLDKEEIRIGKTGQYIFDIADWSKFNFFGIVPPSKNLDAGAITMRYEKR